MALRALHVEQLLQHGGDFRGNYFILDELLRDLSTRHDVDEADVGHFYQALGERK